LGGSEEKKKVAVDVGGVVGIEHKKCMNESVPFESFAEKED